MAPPLLAQSPPELLLLLLLMLTALLATQISGQSAAILADQVRFWFEVRADCLLPFADCVHGGDAGGRIRVCLLHGSHGHCGVSYQFHARTVRNGAGEGPKLGATVAGIACLDLPGYERRCSARGGAVRARKGLGEVESQWGKIRLHLGGRTNAARLYSQQGIN